MPRRERRSFTPEFKARTVEPIESTGKSIAEVCRELDLTQSAVRHWVELARVDRGEKARFQNTFSVWARWFQPRKHESKGLLQPVQAIQCRSPLQLVLIDLFPGRIRSVTGQVR